MSIKDGGPAYPCQPLERDGMPSAAMEPGLSIRDHFAGLAMAALIVAHKDSIANAATTQSAYEYADAMIQAREAGQ